MSQTQDFKIGDEVICIDPTIHNKFLILGEKYTVKDVREDGLLELQGVPHQWQSTRFELVKPEKEEFCMKTNPWFICVDNSPSRYDCIIEFLVHKGFNIRDDQKEFTPPIRCIANCHPHGAIVPQNKVQRFFYSDNFNKVVKEIKIQWEEKIEIKHVTYPKILSEKDKKIQEQENKG